MPDYSTVPWPPSPDRAACGERATRLWLDVEDLFEHLAHFGQPSGIQRVAIELGRALHQSDPAGARTGFCRHALTGESFAAIDWAEVEGALAASAARRAPRHLAQERRRLAGPRRWVRGALARLPGEYRTQTTRLLGASLEAARAALTMLRLPFRPGPRQPAHEHVRDDGAGAFATRVRAGDVLLTVGAVWRDPRFGSRIRRARQRFGLRYAVLIHDAIPLVRPEWVHPGAVDDFRRWIVAALPQADTVLTVSDATSRDLVAVTGRLGIPLVAPIRRVTLGSGFGLDAYAATDVAPIAGEYVLFVSTLDARKNHQLLFRVWRRLLEERRPEEVPTLVFAGRVGWMVADLMQSLENTQYLDDKVRIVPDPTDDELAALYRGCLFTLYPSLYEGWGLPVIEGFSFGKPCLAAERTSLPEAGGALARYFDPESVASCHAAVAAWLFDRDALQAATERVKREFRLVPWAETAAALRRAVAVAA